jgi:hypothetical protein
MSRRSSVDAAPILYAYVVAAIVLRILPHPWNLTPVGAMFLFSGATFRRRWEGWLVPLAALIVSDIAVVQVLYGGRYSWFSPVTWTAFSLLGVIGWTLRPKVTVPRVAAAAVAGSLGFFLITNFAVWLGGKLYPLTLAGLAQCYTAALPFLRNDLAGNLAYGAVMFGSYHWLLRRKTVPARQAV